ncbi:hypothetical protein BOS5A_200284 [Bosea sp. EC-HK365B]|nr:hypothetical protein BOSE21B_100285 [Bosea sp. 21B]CAD5284608.1 hypothetical protein BOSE7B_41246 [Bosea sp. 7B]VVT57812.1 hypothetical protein BOS5A_200284 [Bosea sp. EC-HK365B]VXC91773.1 hypothetical protein BOSE127_80030 [Bosea sp. 127]
MKREKRIILSIYQNCFGFRREKDYQILIASIEYEKLETPYNIFALHLKK